MKNAVPGKFLQVYEEDKTIHFLQQAKAHISKDKKFNFKHRIILITL